MIKIEFAPRVREFFTSSKFLNSVSFLAFTMLMTVVIASQNFFFQNIIENGVSKRDIVAQKTLTVEDVKKTEQHRKEVAQRVESVYAPAEDEFIQNNLQTLQTSVMQIRRKAVDESVKKEEIGILFDLSDSYKKDFIINFLLKADDNNLHEVFDKANITLSNVLRAGITEKDYEKDNIDKIILSKMMSNVSKRQVSIIKAVLEQVIVPNLVVDEFATEIARKNAQNSVKPYEVVFEKGDKILFEGEPVTRLKRDALREAGYNVYELNWKGLAAIFFFVLIGTSLFISYMKFFEKEYFERKYMSLTACLTILMAFIGVVLPTGTSPYVIPIPAFLILLSIFIKPRVALVATIILTSLMVVGFQYNTQYLVTFILLSLFAIIAVSQIHYAERLDIIKIGFNIGLVGLILTLSIYILEKCLIEVDNLLLLQNCTIILLNGFLSAVIVSGVMPLLESAFDIITPYGLAELGDHNKPLLKKLQKDAPGTYHHSLMVSSLCEAAAEAIGADPILARVGALYHDIGKLKRPLFFVENQSYFLIENPHNKITPRISKMIITAHPKEGLEIARDKKYKLPQVIQNFIIQHHGEGLVSYFYNQAVQEEGAENVKEEQFRYTGPKPNTKETAILMIADAVESAVRSLKSPTSEEIENMINKIIVDRLNDCQLSDSPLTLKDLQVIATTFSRILRGMQHNRIKYQENVAAEFDKDKINMPTKLIDEDLENKIKQLEGNDVELNKKEDNNDKN